MTRTARQVRLLADTLDSQGKADQPITVIGTRAHLMRQFKPAKRGGVLLCGNHELRLIKRAPKGQLQNHDWAGGE
jgi:hypothetical protein